jgi:hypothetical protein
METLVLEPIAASFPTEVTLEVKSATEVVENAKKKVTYLKEGVTVSS